MSGDSDNVIHLTGTVRRDFLRKAGRCRHEGGFTVDQYTGDVECDECGQPVSAAHAMISLALRYERIAQQVASAREEVKTLKAYAPHLRAAKRAEAIWRGGHLPACPHCQKGIEADSFGHTRVWRQRSARKPR